MNYETLRARYGEAPERETTPPEAVQEEQTAETADAPAAVDAVQEEPVHAEAEVLEEPDVKAPEEAAEQPAAAEDPVVRELLNKQSERMAELGQQMTRLEQQLAALSNGVDQMRQDAGRNAASAALAPQIEALRQASARQEKANVDILRDSKNFQATVREQMQSELDRYHKMFADTAHAPILSAIANLYIVSERAISFLKDAKERRNVEEIVLEGMLEILEEQGVVVSRTPVGEKRSVKTCRTRKTIPTGDAALHGTVAASISPSFVLGNQILIKESIDTYIYDASLAAADEQAEAPAAAETAEQPKPQDTEPAAAAETTVPDAAPAEAAAAADQVPPPAEAATTDTTPEGDQ